MSVSPNPIVLNDNVKKIVESIGKIKLNRNNIIETLHTVMQSVETVDKTLRGSDKKTLALDTLNFIVDNQDELSDEEKFVLKTLIVQVVPQAVDIIIKVSNGLSDLVTKSVSKCFCF